MKLLVIIILSVFISQEVSASGCEHTDTTFKCVKYLKNYDADTVTFNIPNIHPLLGKKISIRVRGVDTPEKRGKLPCEKEASRIAQRLVQNLLKNAKTIELSQVGRDKYFRVLADVKFDGKNLKDILLKNKLAYPYFGGTKEKRNWCGVMSAKK